MDKSRTETSGCQDRIHLVFKYIETHLASPLSLVELARHCHISPFHFHRLFRAVTDETLGCYVRRLRIERAMMFLLNSDRSVEEIATAVGYQSTSAFYRAFKKIFSVSPTTFRCDHDINRRVSDKVGDERTDIQTHVYRQLDEDDFMEHIANDDPCPCKSGQHLPMRPVRGGKSRR